MGRPSFYAMASAGVSACREMQWTYDDQNCPTSTSHVELEKAPGAEINLGRRTQSQSPNY